MANIGDRVGAILSANNKEVELLGFGTYLGEQVPSIEENEVLHHHGVKNPKIQLDNGSIVWGFECWWGPEEKIKESIGNRKVINVNIEGEEID